MHMSMYMYTLVSITQSVSLLDALYNQACVTASTPYYLLLLHLLTQALAPYFKWVYRELCRLLECGWMSVSKT